MEQDSKDTDLLRLVALAALQKGGIETGSRYLEQAVESSPDDSCLLAQFGLSEIALGETTADLAALESAIESDSGLPRFELHLIQK